MKNKKLTTTLVAVTTAAALLLSGTFAWQSINQTALNEASDIVNPGGRLHDDFDGSNKDIYVENFAEEPIYARVRLNEYFEVVMNYGSAAQKVETLVGTQKTGDIDTSAVDANIVYDGEGNPIYERQYATYLFDGNVDENGNVKAAVDGTGKSWWDWTTGGSTVYMPTFNLNKDSLEADVNGIYEEGNIGTISNRFDPDDPQYTKYVEYGAGDTEEGTEIYDGDVNGNDEVGDDFENLEAYSSNIQIVENVTHTAKETGYAELISMAEWLDLLYETDDGEGNYDADSLDAYWVYDTDGWVYYSKAIPGRNEDGTTNATGLLLNGIELAEVMDDTWYYAIEVEGQFVTANDVGKTDGTGFYDTENGTVPSAEAEELLKAIGVDMSGEADGEGDGGGSASDLAMTFSSSPEYKVGENGPYIEISRDRSEDYEWNLWDCSEGDFTLSSSNESVTFAPYGEDESNLNIDMNVVIPTSVTEDFTVTAKAMNSDKTVTFTVVMVDGGSEGGDENTALPMALTLTHEGVELEKNGEGNYIVTALEEDTLTLNIVGGMITYENEEVESYYTKYHAHSTSTVDASLNGDEGIHYVTSLSSSELLMTVDYHSGAVNVSPTDEEYVVQLQVEGYCYTNEDETEDALAEGFVYLTVIPAGGSSLPDSGEPITLSYDVSSSPAFAGGHPWLTPNDDTLQMVVTLESDGGAVDASAIEWSVTGGGEFNDGYMSYTTITPSVSESGVLKVDNDTNDMLGYRGYPITVTATYGAYSDSVTIIFTDASGYISCEVADGALTGDWEGNYSGANVDTPYTLTGTNQQFNGQPVDDGVYDYEWVVTDENGAPTENASVNSDNQFIATAAGTYKVTWQIAGCPNCSDTITIIVE